VRFASGSAAAVAAQGLDCCARMTAAGAQPRLTTDAEEEDSWSDHYRQIWSSSAAIVRASWLPADALGTLELLNTLPTPDVELVGRLGVGAGLVGLDGDIDAQAASIQRMRGSTVVGNVVIVRGSRELKTMINVWGPRSNAPLLASIKRELDPNGILGAGRGPL
jgi:hypothetical protein